MLHKTQSGMNTKDNHEWTQKTQLTNARINCALKDLCFDSPLGKIVKFTIVASNVSSIPTKVLKCPYTNNDSIFTHNGSKFKASES